MLSKDPITNITQLIGEPVGYEGIMGIAIVTTRFTDDILRYWLDKKDAKDSNGNLLYANGPMKAAYGSFLQSLLVVKCHDMVADAAATKYNVTWTRTTPIVVSTLDDAYNTLLTGEMDHRMGMDVTGDADDVRAFRFACSSSFSPIEYWVGQVLFPTYNSTGNLNGSVTLGLGNMLLNGESLEIIESNGYIIIRALGDNQKLLIIDPESGLVMDGMVPSNETVCGSFCYSDLQTEWATDLGESILGYGQPILNILNSGNGIIDFSQLATNTRIGLTGFLSSAMMSLGSASMFFMDNIPFNSFSTLLGLNMIGLSCFNAYAGRSEGINGESNERRSYVVVNAASTITHNYTNISRIGMHQDINWNKPLNFVEGALEFVYGWGYSLRSADGPHGSNVNNDEAVRGRLIVDYGWDKASKAWNADWYIWVPDGNYHDFLDDYARGNNMVIEPA